jgi:hypothetical protein
VAEELSRKQASKGLGSFFFLVCQNFGRQITNHKPRYPADQISILSAANFPRHFWAFRIKRKKLLFETTEAWLRKGLLLRQATVAPLVFLLATRTVQLPALSMTALSLLPTRMEVSIIHRMIAVVFFG